ncbi:kynureninase [Portibacter marinus]|uniref:kynureninase n=1 Tax=Portibacter marinus TaxID=2898660 RepID=UPI001F2D3C99|nr:kynureninase [Portibacter marinus]
MANPFIKNIDLLDVSNMLYDRDQSFADKMDREDPLRQYKADFYFPKNQEGVEMTYLCGNSLGLQSKQTQAAIQQVSEQWKDYGVKGHFNGEHPWVPFHLGLKENMSKIVGALPSEVTLMNTLTVNLHLMLTSFFRPEGRRNKILIEQDVFPSDRYAIESHLEWHGLSIEDHLIYIPKSTHNGLVDEKIIKDFLTENGEEIALVLIGGVNYYTGQFLNIPAITQWAHEQGCIIGFDLAHAVGNVPLALHDANVDFAVWCTYKYLNAGPGSIAGAFVHERHHDDRGIPKLKGWWGHDAEIRFKMRDAFKPAPGIESWQISCQPILSLAPVKASLEMFIAADMKAIRNKSILLTGYLEFLLKELKTDRIKILTPALQAQRGCQLSIFIESADESVHHELTKAGMITDWRNPGVVRVAPAPLYNGYRDVWEFVKALKKVLQIGG